MIDLINPYILYVGLAVGGIGVGLALPRRGMSPQGLGALIAAAAMGVVVLFLSLAAAGSGALPNLYFYVFSVIALGASLRVITHPRPVYAALYFILTILSSAGLYLILSAEFMAFALIIVYAGAILITYLFVIMLATQAPSEEEIDKLADYDSTAREPAAPVAGGFVLLAALTAMIFNALPGLRAEGADAKPDRILAVLPGAVEDALRAPRLDPAVTTHLGEPLIQPDEKLARIKGELAVDPVLRTAEIETPDGRLRTVEWPEDLRSTNVQGLGANLLNDHPGSIEIAGVVLLMAMLGAVVLARRQVTMDEDVKAATGEEGPA